MNVIDVFKKFAPFCTRAGVLANFDIYTDDTDYNELKVWAESLPEIGRLAEIEHFIFSEDAAELEGIIKNCNGYFMLVEYGVQQTSPPDNERKRITEQPCSVVIGKVLNKKTQDSIKRTITNNHIEDLIYKMVNMLAVDDTEVCHFNRITDKTLAISPTEPTLLYGAVGWEWAFTVQSYKIDV